MTLAQPDPLAESLACSLYELDADAAEGVLTEFQRGWELELVMAKVRQQRIAEATQRIEHAAIEGIGTMTMQIDPFAFHYWGQRLGYDCWQDPEFKREFQRDNPEVRVRNVARKQTIVKSRELGVRSQGSGAGGIVLTDRRGNALN